MYVISSVPMLTADKNANYFGITDVDDWTTSSAPPARALGFGLRFM